MRRSQTLWNGFARWAQKNKDASVDAYFECKAFGKRPADKFARWTENEDIRDAVDEIVFRIGYERDLEIQAKLNGLEFK